LKAAALFIGVETAPGFFHCFGMQRIGLIFILLAGLVGFAGCHQPVPTLPEPISTEDLLPKHAQPKLPTLKLYLGDLGAETLDAELALTREQVMTDAMLFVFSAPHQASFWMKSCPESLSAAYIDPAGVIAEIRHLEQNDTNSVVAASANIQYVLEVKEGWFTRHGISPGTIIRTERGSLPETFFRKN
jgi:uncharacterized membrane protein (UPF0127 family)